MSIINISKPTSSIANQTKINIGLVWDADLKTWSAELRTWDELQSLISNNTKISSSMVNQNKP